MIVHPHLTRVPRYLTVCFTILAGALCSACGDEEEDGSDTAVGEPSGGSGGNGFDEVPAAAAIGDSPMGNDGAGGTSGVTSSGAEGGAAPMGAGGGAAGAGEPPVEIGTFEGLTGTQYQVAVNNYGECYLDASGIAQCELSSFWSDPPAGALQTIATGDETFCGLDAEGALHCWWDDDFPGLREGPFTSIAVGDELVCGVRPSRKVECWGAEDNRAGYPPDEEFVEVAIDRDIACGILVDGGIRCWGDTPLGGKMYPGDFSQLSIYGNSVCGLTSSGDIECPEGPSLDGLVPGPYRHLAVGSSLVCAVLMDGGVTCNGNSTLSRLQPPPGQWEQVSVHDRDACVRNAEGMMECWGLSLGDGGSDMMCEPHQNLLSGMRDGSPWSAEFDSSLEDTFLADIIGYRYIYETWTSDPYSSGLFVFDGSGAYDGNPRSQLPADTQVPIDRVLWMDGGTETELGDFFCSAGGSSIELSSDELLIDLQNLHALGACEDGAGATGEISVEGGSSTSVTLDGVDVMTLFEGLGGGYNEDGSGAGTTVMRDGSVFRARWGVGGTDDAGGSIAWAIYVASKDGPLAGAAFCTTTGTIANAFDSATVSATNFHRIGDCPTEVTGDAISGCMR